MGVNLLRFEKSVFKADNIMQILSYTTAPKELLCDFLVYGT